MPEPDTGGARRASELWSEAEDQLLRLGVAKHANRNWKSIAEGLENKTAIQCLHRWRKVSDPQTGQVIKGPWTSAEDEKVRTLVTERGPQKWSAIIKRLPGRLGKQCRERWHNHLDPNIRSACLSHRSARSSPRTGIWETSGPRSLSACPVAATTLSRITGTVSKLKAARA